ncbi:CysQ protein [SAR11 cluster bacterium PRT-SC02]|nr:CysQ protein [SAR11 cluster bacterium PRT-SC02]
MKELNLKNICESLVNTFELAGKNSISLYKKGLKIKIKNDNSPVSNGDIEVNKILTDKINQLTPDIPVISEETVNLEEKNKNKVFWLIDPIDGTKEYIAGKDEYTLNAALVINQKPVIGLVGVPKKGRLFYSYGEGKSFLKEKEIIKKISCQKKTDSTEIKAVSSVIKPSDIILNKLKSFNVTSISKVASSYKFCLIANGEFDIYAAKERANEWDYAAGHAVAEGAGATITTLDGKPFLYGKEDYKNPSLLILRSKNLND